MDWALYGTSRQSCNDKIVSKGRGLFMTSLPAQTQHMQWILRGHSSHQENGKINPLVVDKN